jgi:hypothetical protein
VIRSVSGSRWPVPCAEGAPGPAPFSPMEPREPRTGAKAGRLAQTVRDAVRALLQVRGSSADSLRPRQTGRSCLEVKGARVQIPPSSSSSRPPNAAV